MTLRHMLEGGALIFVAWAIGWSYGQQSGWKDGYSAGKDVGRKMLENQDRMINQLTVIRGGRK